MLGLPQNGLSANSSGMDTTHHKRANSPTMPQLPEEVPEETSMQQRPMSPAALVQQGGRSSVPNDSANERVSPFEQEMWRLLNGAGSDLAALHAKDVESNKRDMDLLRRTNVALKEELGRLRAAATSAEYKPGRWSAENKPGRWSAENKPGRWSAEDDVSALQVVEEAAPTEFLPSMSSQPASDRRPSFVEAARRFSAGVRSSFQAALGLGGRKVSFAPGSVLPEVEGEDDDAHGMQRRQSNKLLERMEAIRRATANANMHEATSDAGSSDSENDDNGSEMPLHEKPSICSNDFGGEKPKKQMRFAASVRSVGSADQTHFNNFELLPTWADEVELRGVSRRKVQSAINLDEDSEIGDDEIQNKPARLETFLQKLVIYPNSVKMTVWETLGSLFIFYDSIALPLQFSDINMHYTVFLVIGWIIRIYWTIHIPVSMFSSYEQINGRIQTKVTKIMSVYLRGRFAWDLLLAVFDWLVIFMDNQKMGLLKWLRITRLARIVQAKAMPSRVKKMLDKGGAGHGETLLAIIKDVFLLLWSTHLGACLWYGIGISDQGNDNWIDLAREDGYDVGTPGFIYIHAFRWQLTNFVGESGLDPRTVPEYCFLIFTSICGFVATCVCVSSMTSAMTRLDITLAQESRNFSLLRQYLTDHKISSKIATRVVQNAQYHVLLQKRRTPEEQIELLSLVSQPLKIELHFEINMKVLGSHPLFHVYSLLNEQAMRQICHTAVSRLDIAKGDILFHAEELSHTSQMYFVNDGKITYTHHSGEIKTLTERGWACEPVLWTLWMHRGTARAKSECTLSLLNLSSLQDVAKQDMSGNKFFIFKYAEYFIDYLNEAPPHILTDLDSEDVDIAWFVQKALPEDMPKQKRKEVLGEIMSNKTSELERPSMFKLVPFFRESAYSIRFRSSSFRGSSSSRDSKNSSGSGRHLRGSDGDKLQLAANIVDNDGPSRRTRVAGAAFVGVEDSRASYGSAISSDFGSSIGEDFTAHSGAPAQNDGSSLSLGEC